MKLRNEIKKKITKIKKKKQDLEDLASPYLDTLHIKALLYLNTIGLGFSNEVTSSARPYLDLT